MWINKRSVIVAIITCLVVSEIKGENVSKGVLMFTEHYLKHNGSNSSLEVNFEMIKNAAHTLSLHTPEQNGACESDDDCRHGNRTDVQCVWDEDEEDNVCKCDDSNKLFDEDFHYCRDRCKRNSDCKHGGLCVNVVDKYDNYQKFCNCKRGTSGNFCEVIDECVGSPNKCGNGTVAECVWSTKKRRAVCKCKENGKAFDEVLEQCKSCNCGIGQLGCEFQPGGLKTCFCERMYYSKEGVCQECNCGDHAISCKLENDTKVCDCKENYSDDGNGTCKVCNCGSKSIGCSFKEDVKTCKCKEGYINYNGTCREMCFLNYCSNGAKCIDSVCQCLPGTTGDYCNIVEACITDEDTKKVCGNPDYVYCAFNSTTQNIYCRCRIMEYFYDPYDNDCKDCDCGQHGNCSFVKGAKTCACEEGYAVNNYSYYYEKNGQCQECKCGSRSQGCEFKSYYQKTCYCDEGYKQNYADKCQICDCGKRGQCHFDGWRKVCDCDDGYADNDGTCEACDCGPGGKCSFDNGIKTCECEDGYAVNGVLNEVKCKFCNCHLGFSMMNCTFNYFGSMECFCPPGFKQEKKDCVDINECLDSSSCPDSTFCVNTYGSYECPCRDGFRLRYEDSDSKLYGCDDIDECFESGPCPFTDTTICVNTVGSYRCQCTAGYNPEPYGSEKYKGCFEDQSDWQLGYIALLVLFSFIIIGLLMKICVLRCRK